MDDLPEALHSFSVTVTEIQLQMTNGKFLNRFGDFSLGFFIKKTYLKVAPLQALKNHIQFYLQIQVYF